MFGFKDEDSHGRPAAVQREGVALGTLGFPMELDLFARVDMWEPCVPRQRNERVVENSPVGPVA